MESSQTDVVVASSPDWNSIRESYMHGNAIEEIAQAHGVSIYAINCRASSQGWRAMKSQALTIARQEIGERIRKALITSIMRDALAFEGFEMPPLASVEHEIASRNRARLIESASRLIGWAEVDACGTAKQVKVVDI